MKRKAWLIMLMASGVLAACSSAPKAASGVYDSRNEAARMVQLGAKSLREGGLSGALGFYAEAYRLYTAADDPEGRVRSLDGLGRVAIGTGQPVDGADAGALWANAQAVAADSGDPAVVALADLLRAEWLTRSGTAEDARAALALAGSAAAALAKRPTDRARGLRVAASAAKILMDYPAALAYLEDAAAIDKKAKAFIEYASDRYLAASILSKQGDYAAAEAALRDALENDRKAEHPAGIAGDYLALGLVAEKAGRRADAARLYARAAEIYAAARFPAAAADAEARRAAAAAAE